MKAKGLVWLGTRTPEFEATTRFFGGPLGLHAEHTEPDFAVFRLPNDGKVEVFGPGDRDHEHFTTGPVAGFLVDDVEEARAELEERRDLLYWSGASLRPGYRLVPLRRPRWQRLPDNPRRLTDVAAAPDKGNPSCSTHQ